MSSELTPLQVALVSQDVSLLHEVSWLLETVGYRVETTNDFSQDALWRRYSFADFVIIDGRAIAEPTSATFTHDSENPLYRIFLYDPAKATDFEAWYAAGAHDALRMPLSRGELLARMRTGARYLEFEARLERQSARCKLPGMLSRRGLLRKLRKLQASADFGASHCAMLATSIDWYRGIRRRSGEVASRSLVSAAARAIRRAAGDNAASAYLGDGRFVTLVTGQPLVAVKTIAESLAHDFSSRESHHELVPRPTLTSAITPWSEGGRAEEFLNDALETLGLAEHSGGDCVVLHNQFSNELAAWQNEVSSGNPFANVVAQDVMEPFPAVLQNDLDHHELREALSLAGVPVRPYVDHGGRLLGVADTEEPAAETSVRPAAGLQGEPFTVPETIPYNASFADIYETFSTRGCAALVVTAGDQPLGYVTCDGFLSMIDPVHRESFAHSDKPVDKTSYLVVPSTLCESPATQPACSS